MLTPLLCLLRTAISMVAFAAIAEMLAFCMAVACVLTRCRCCCCCDAPLRGARLRLRSVEAPGCGCRDCSSGCYLSEGHLSCRVLVLTVWMVPVCNPLPCCNIQAESDELLGPDCCPDFPNKNHPQTRNSRNSNAQKSISPGILNATPQTTEPRSS